MCSTPYHNDISTVKNWALKFGVDLWEFGRHFTKMNQIQNKYHEYNVEVVRKDGLLLVRELAAEVKNYMDFKINAVMAAQSCTQSFMKELGVGRVKAKLNVSRDGNVIIRSTS
ncbi:hypothetical protein O3G_MSEX006641 [Manduca sexta]|uniref:Uncharacterized protein n=1 Tax=Manduca sexta TaxID=7130 RepID=A0A921Z361_MANSE|nr:hypothetical protein O3G_MSEX006641 [Manduca sexta]